MSRWYPEIKTHWDATKAIRMGRYGAYGLALWLGIPAIIGLALGNIQKGLVNPIDILIITFLVGLSLYAAKRFAAGQGARIGSVLLIVLVVEVAKRILLTFSGTISFGIFDAVVTFIIFFSLLNGVRGARASPNLVAEDDLKDVFE